MITQKIGSLLQLEIKGWSYNGKSRDNGGWGPQPKDDTLWLGSKSGKLKEGDQIVFHEAHKNIHSQKLLRETAIFSQPWVRIIGTFIFPKRALETISLPRASSSWFIDFHGLLIAPESPTFMVSRVRQWSWQACSNCPCATIDRSNASALPLSYWKTSRGTLSPLMFFFFF